MLNMNTKKKIKKIIEKIEKKENPEPKKKPCKYIQQIKSFHNNVAYVGVPKKNILIPFDLKKGDWVTITLEKMNLEDVK